MKALYLGIVFTLTTFSNSFSQEIDGTEIGFDVAFSASNFGGTAGLGLKYGWKYGDYLIFGPSLRYQRSWNKNVTTGTQGGFNVYGGGAFVHARFYNVFFVGSELEILKSPYTSNGYLSTSKNWVGTWLFGGGFSMEFEEKFRLNAGIMYDVLDIPNYTDPTNINPNSPLQPYVARNKQTGAAIPIIYRISFFIPLP